MGDSKGPQGNLKYLGDFGKIKKTEDKKEKKNFFESANDFLEDKTGFSF